LYYLEKTKDTTYNDVLNLLKIEFVYSLYNAVAHQLKVNGETPLSLHDLRTKAADYLRENQVDFLPFLPNPDSDDLLTPEEYEKYCNDVAETSAWGGAIEVRTCLVDL